MSELEVRAPTDEEAPAFFGPTITAFGMHPNPERLAEWAPILRTGLSVGVLDGPQWVGGASALIDELCLTGGARLRAAMVTMVGMVPTHRRRGALRRLMAAQLDAAAAQELPVAVLISSESTIYGRFGYGPATWSAHVEIDTDRAAFTEPVGTDGTLQLVAKGDALAPLHTAYERCLGTRAGELGRSKGFWRTILADPEKDRRGSSELFVLVHHDDAGEADGAATYRLKLDFDRCHNLADGTLDVIDLFGTDPGVEAALWQGMLSVDLVRRVRARSRPVDDPLRWRLVEPRQLRTTGLTDWLWVRILDVETSLAARSYASADRLVLEVTDDMRPAQSGTYVLDATGERATCERSSVAVQPDLRAPISSLGSLLLGGVAPSTLAAAGRIGATDPAALDRADALFRTNHTPHCATDF